MHSIILKGQRQIWQEDKERSEVRNVFCLTERYGGDTQSAGPPQYYSYPASYRVMGGSTPVNITLVDFVTSAVLFSDKRQQDIIKQNNKLSASKL